MLKFNGSLLITINLIIRVRKKELYFFQKFSNATNLNYQANSTMKVLNVAEKNDAAKNIAGYLSRGTSRRVS